MCLRTTWSGREHGQSAPVPMVPRAPRRAPAVGRAPGDGERITRASGAAGSCLSQSPSWPTGAWQAGLLEPGSWHTSLAGWHHLPEPLLAHWSLTGWPTGAWQLAPPPRATPGPLEPGRLAPPPRATPGPLEPGSWHHLPEPLPTHPRQVPVLLRWQHVVRGRGDSRVLPGLCTPIQGWGTTMLPPQDRRPPPSLDHPGTELFLRWK